MDGILVEKLGAMKMWKKMNVRCSALYMLMVHLQLAIALLFLGLFCWGPIWVPKAVSAAAQVVSVRAATATAVCFQPKFLFMVCNIIVVLLVGESRQQQQTVMVQDTYAEYMQRYSEIHKDSVTKGEEKKIEPAFVERVEVEGEDSDEAGGESQESTEDEVDEVGEDSEDEEEDGMSCVELNRKVEEFIAKVNEQRRLEARRSA